MSACKARDGGSMSKCFVLAAEDHLRRKMTKMEERMHALEDALAIVQAQSPKAGAHPLLKTPFSLDDDDEFDYEPEFDYDMSGGEIGIGLRERSIGRRERKRGSRDMSAGRAGVDRDQDGGVGGLADAFGGLHMEGDHGASRFFGPSGGSESLLLKAKEIAESEPLKQPPSSLPLPADDTSYLPRPIQLFYAAFPLTPPLPPAPVQSLIESFLPPLPRATQLCETLLANLTWMFSIVSHRHLVGDLIPAIYLSPDSAPRIYGAHDLALLLIALGIGALVDLGERPYTEEARHYYRLARAALGLESILDKRSVTTVKALHLMSVYNGMSGEEGNLEHCYSLLNMAGEVALASLVTGRPPVILETFIDCHLPTAEEEEAYTQGEVPLGCESLRSAMLEHYRHFNAVGVWSYRFTLECLLPVAKAVLASQPPTYRTILDLDKRIREFHIPVKDQGGAGGENSMQVFVRSHYSELTLLFLHRGFFAQALTDNPRNPIMSAHGQSFISAYKAACAVLDSTRAQYAHEPGVIARVWRVWSYAFSATVIIGTVAIRSVNSLLDPNPYEKLEQACTLFRSGAETNSRALRALPILNGMLEKGRQARQSALLNTARTPVESYDELAIFGGRTGLVLPKGNANDHSASVSNSPPFNIDPFLLPAMPSLLPDARTPTGTVFPSALGDPQQLYFMDDEDLSAPDSWEGLYREIPEPSYSYGASVVNPGFTGPANPLGEAMLEDRWSSFMHQYALLGSGQRDYRS
ncbi:hypothetical protein HWV62_11856 [Athelia sp. TMB]|nr:hypothetical protein HWV62_11856 [Athelia sp. TMB]